MIKNSWKTKSFILASGIVLFPLPIDNLKFILLSVLCLGISADAWRSGQKNALFPLAVFAFPLFSFCSVIWSADPTLALGESFRWLIFSLFSYLICINIKIDEKFGSSTTTILSSIFIFYLVFHLVAVQLDTSLNFEWNALMTRNKDYTSSLLVCLFPFLLFYKSENQFVRFIKIISTLLILNLLVHTGSRGAMLALAVIILLKLYNFYANTRWRFLIVLSFMGVIIYGIHFMNSSTSANDLLFVKEYREQLDSRVGLNKLSIEQFTKTPILGVGTGQWNREIYVTGVSDLSPYNSQDQFLRHRSHNLYFKTLTELGITGFIFLFIFIAYTLLKTKKKWTLENSYIKAAWVSLVAVMIINYFYAVGMSYEFFFSGIQFLGYLSIGILLTKMTEDSRKIPAINILLVLFSILCILWYSYSKLNWDRYKRVVQYIEAEDHSNAITSLTSLFHPVFNTSHGISISVPHLLAEQYLVIGDIENADKYYLVALTLAPNHEPLLLSYARFLFEKKRDEQGALRYLDRILSIQNNHLETLQLRKKILE